MMILGQLEEKRAGDGQHQELGREVESGFADFYQDTVDDIIKENRSYFFAEHLFQN
ncbi:hypothetical protein NST69_20875 [Paenibacillus sp. FSL P2-0089]|uniref:hypothetical protein n=1 Tax=Paenibacillus sp. FSL P2-0089 TaxID=2954526 RepID=UPI003159F48F